MKARRGPRRRRGEGGSTHAMGALPADIILPSSSPAIRPRPRRRIPSCRGFPLGLGSISQRALVSTYSGIQTLVAGCSPASSPAPAGSPGLYSAGTFELTAGNVDLVLEDVRPYLIADGGNVEVVSVENGIISLRLQGACGSCPSSTTTMTMGIERVLREKFGDALREIRQAPDEPQAETTADAVNRHLDVLRPAIKNYGGSVEVISVDRGECHVRYVGPESIGSGVKAAIKERFPDIQNVVFSG